ncbi:MAG: hydroxyacid dehydrogenase [Candidatus Nezhaarchaeota archaeon]|nr:hydroxyacid dehydrogenase [Candidatus Nezhaarchaeota archaeon]MCX8141861.1 hydroxyacid dehydrogenase [Candidatus Nezhaarchaeota archaeon]MDW8050358.1 hydroxyacid dehydrogenase [Nitrososphaerota archaeon]
MTFKVLVTDNVHESCASLLRAKGCKVDVKPSLSKEELIKAVKEYDAIIIRGKTKFTGDVIMEAESLKVIGRAGVGLDNIDVEAASEKNIKVISTPQASTIAVAEATIALMLSLARMIPEAVKSLKEGEWHKSKFMGFELRGKVLGIVGFGRIGKAVAKRALAFEMKVIAHDIRDIREEASTMGVEVVPTLEELLRRSDIVTLHIPLNRSTRHLIGEKEISLMKSNAIIINTSRGGIIETKALLKALKEGKLAGAALDVFEHEPPQTEEEWELIRLPNVIATPHISSQTEEAQRLAGIMVAEEVLKALNDVSL